MAEFSNVEIQTVNPGESIIFDTTDVPCNKGLVRHREGSGNFLLSGYVPYDYSCGCGCNRTRTANYLVDFGANIAIPTTGGTVDSISVAIAIDGSTLPSSIMTVTPAAVEEYFNVSRAINAEIWRNCCETVTVKNISNQPILVQNANIIFSRPDMVMMRY